MPSPGGATGVTTTVEGVIQVLSPDDEVRFTTTIGATTKGTVATDTVEVGVGQFDPGDTIKVIAGASGTATPVWIAKAKTYTP